MRDTVTKRIQALSKAHDVLTGKQWDVAGLRHVVMQSIEPFNTHGRIHFSGPHIDVSHRASSTLTLALHELATDAVKYGALSSDTGHVRIEWSIDTTPSS